MFAPKSGRLAVLGLCTALSLATAPLRAEDVLQPEAERITDEVVTADLKGMKRLQDRIARLNAGGVGADNYYLVKAQAWLDFAHHEYYENDRSQVIEQAVGQAAWLIGEMERAVSGITLDTPVIGESQRLREDLWKIAAELKQHQGFACAAAPLAEFEVRLVWAGHENKELGWRHAREHFAAAERLAKRARKLADNCICPPEAAKPCPMAETPPPVVAEPAPVLPPPVIPVVTPPEAPPVVPSLLVNVPRNVHFALDKADITGESARVLKRVAEILKAYPHMTITLEGHTDSRASKGYNLKLSKRRVDAVRNHLLKLGVAAERMTTVAMGMERTLNTEQEAVMNHAISRRVEVAYFGENIVSYSQRDDLQVEAARKAAQAKKAKAGARKPVRKAKPRVKR